MGGAQPSREKRKVGCHAYTRICDTAENLQSNQIAGFKWFKWLLTARARNSSLPSRPIVQLLYKKVSIDSVSLVMFKTNAVQEAAIAASRTMGYEGMKSEQLQIVESFMTGHDVFGVLPTGYGKSLCYACLPLVFDCLLQKPSGFSIVLVVSPLVALMKDQVRQMPECDFRITNFV